MTVYFGIVWFVNSGAETDLSFVFILLIREQFVVIICIVFR